MPNTSNPLTQKHPQANAVIQNIARDVLDLETLEERKMDSLDFHNMAVWNIKQALLDAYTAGFEAGKKSRTK